MLLVVHHAFHSTTSRGLSLAEIGHHRLRDSPFAGRGQIGRNTLAAVIARRCGKPRVAVAALLAAVAAAATSCGTASAYADPPVTGGTHAPAAAAAAAATPLPLAGKTVGIDPGHNGRNYTDPSFLDRQVWNGRTPEDCDTTGTATDGGYTEALFNFRVAGYLRADLVRDGARVVMTRTSNNGIGPCVTQRAAVINASHADVAVDIHADGAPSWGRGFTVLEPVADGPNDGVIASSARLAADVRAAMIAGTAMPVSNYDGKDGTKLRDDLAGLNLTTVPKILIEVGNMKNPADAAMLTSAAFQQQVAAVLLRAIVTFMR
ncbi:MAG TPA: N-acetylmuramoyl-L-alanine amidase [Streptosporangiaceae bacterium]|nr:N-acetylmuramoyl-L-alanine amidase [Streptosporangiaceae bacterium]